eukprot:TRINITY_DN5525_c0_g1_i3.p1 TRINITY_DN5525_c0_g1~~TRINITY_DN5525_c0_g1_i3.p1  ORF type:complete len:1655 (-),score=257.85 TRINITY_DN5525_c0_g1_i3:220-5184(-)
MSSASPQSPGTHSNGGGSSRATERYRAASESSRPIFPASSYSPSPQRQITANSSAHASSNRPVKRLSMSPHTSSNGSAQPSPTHDSSSFTSTHLSLNILPREESSGVIAPIGTATSSDDDFVHIGRVSTPQQQSQQNHQSHQQKLKQHDSSYIRQVESANASPMSSQRSSLSVPQPIATPEKLKTQETKPAQLSAQAQIAFDRVKERLTRGAISKEYWMQDGHCSTCYICQSTFNIFRRRHHCRLCGQIFCSSCTTFMPIELKATEKKPTRTRSKRVCTYCHKISQEYYTSKKAEESRSPKSLNRRASSALASIPSKPGQERNESTSQKLHGTSYAGSTLINVSPISHGSQLQNAISRDVDIDFDDEADGLEGYNEAERRRMEEENKEVEDDLDQEIDMSTDFIYLSDQEDEHYPQEKESQKREAVHPKEAKRTTSRMTFDFNWMNKMMGYETSVGSKTAESVPAEVIAQSSESLKQQLYSHICSIINKMASEKGLSTEWSDVIINLCQKIVSNITLAHDDCPSHDIRDYIKVKKIPGGSMDDCRYIEGVACTKNIAHKAMASKIPYPRIILLRCPIEFQRNELALTSLHPLLQQEREFLKIQVAKIVSKQPDLLLVEKSVSRVAQEFLLKEKVTLVLNIKPHLMERISWTLNRPIYDSIDQIEEITPTECQSFQLESFRLDQGSRKTLMVLDGCGQNRACSVLLRGSDRETLSIVKQLILFGTYIMRHNMFETALVNDCRALFTTNDAVSDNTLVSIKEGTSLHLHGNFLNQAKSISYGVEFPAQSKTMAVWKPASLYITLAPSENMHSESVPEGYTGNMDLHDDMDMYLSYEVVENKGFGNFYITGHQKLEFLISKCCNNPPSICEEPSLVTIEYYSESDICLGNYLMQTCFSEESICEKQGCKRDMFSHTRSFTHHRTRINMGVHQSLNSIMDNKYYVCVVCSTCESPAPWSELSEDSLNISFGKFLELLFYNKRYMFRAPDCTHPLFRNSIIYFRFNSKVAVFQSEEIFLSNIIGPQQYFALDSPTFIRDADETLLLKHLDEVSLELTAKISHLESTFHLPEEQLAIQDFKLTCRNELINLKKHVQDSKTSSDFFILNKLRRDLISVIDTWDLRYMDIFNKLGEVHAVPRIPYIIDTSEENNLVVPLLGSSPKDEPFALSQDIRPFDPVGLVSPDMDFHSLNMMSSSPNHHTYIRKDFILENLSSEGFEQPTLSASPSSVYVWLEDTDLSSLTGRNRNRRAITDLSAIVGQGKPTLQPQRTITNMPRSIPIVTQKAFAPRFLMEASQGFLFIPPGINGTIVRVFTDEPGSFVAHTLCSLEYSRQIQSFASIPSVTKPDEPIEVRLGWTTNLQDPQARDILEQLCDITRTHVKHKFSAVENGFKTDFICIAYFAKQFQALRRLYLGGDVCFVQSLSRGKKWNATGGKSGSTFCKTLDDRFVIKQISKIEMDHFLSLGVDYFQYMSRVFYQKLPCALVRIVGLYRVGYRRHASGSNYHIEDVVVMENLFYNRKISRVFDLKGSTRSRYVRTTNQNTVLMDQNFLEFIYMSPLYTSEQSKNYLKIAIYNDTKFLSSVNVVDYSILVGIDEENKELVVGIIDYIRQYTWDKQLETWVKSAPVLGQKAKVQPTVISPAQYKVCSLYLFVYFSLSR